MNILQLVPKLNVGGVEKGTIEVARFLTSNGHKAVIVSGGGVMEKDLAAMGARHYTIPVGSKNPFVMIYAFCKLKDVIKKEDIDIVHARSRIPALTGYFAARYTKRAFITTAHGQYKKHFISRVMGWGKVVIVANETMARYMNENFDVQFERMMIIPRGVDLNRFSYVSPSAKKSETFRVGMICRFTPLKGHLDFLKAMSYVFRKIKDLEIILMGDKLSAKPEYMRKIEFTIKKLSLDDIVKFVASSESVPEIMKNMDVLVSANREQEAFGRTIIEAQASGLPVVATRVGGVLENVTDEMSGLLCHPSDPEDMAEKILMYAHDRQLMEKVAQNGRKMVEERYAIDKGMTGTMEAYQRVLREKNILIFKMSSLGDIILSVPSLRAVRKRFPSAKIKVLVDVKFREVLDNCPYIDEVITCDFENRDKGSGFLKLAERLRSENFDMSIDLQNNRKSHLLAFLSFIPDRYGYDNGKLSFLINRKINMPKKPVLPVEHQSLVLGLAGATRVENYLELWQKKDGEL
ncbi:MAG: glycosyltransferase, partial [Candidatus Omnitrophica bacterium]|nr:glycosyltransferase [Candidatus Omnitrophota bacterium]